MNRIPTFLELQVVLRQMRLHHWKEAKKYRYAANLNEIDAAPYVEIAETHEGFVKALNEFFPHRETAELDDAEADMFAQESQILD